MLQWNLVRCEVASGKNSVGGDADGSAVTHRRANSGIVVFALNEYFPDKPVRVVLIVLGGGVLAFLGALIYVNGFLWVMEKLGYRAGPGSFKLTITSTGDRFPLVLNIIQCPLYHRQRTCHINPPSG